jgi:hypothetical protein
MQESTTRAAQTIASFIKKLNECTVVDYSGPAVGRAILIDEASMVDLISFSALVRQLSDTVWTLNKVIPSNCFQLAIG